MNRKQTIADTALQLFAQRGYEHTSTQLIAKEASVSEALIFKHFGNKELLLDYIIKTGYKRIVEHNRGMLQERNPQALIFKVIELPQVLVHEEPLFWKLQSKLVDLASAQKQYERFIQPVHALLRDAFTKLNYENPDKETELILLIIDALWKKLALDETAEIGDLLNLIKTKYGLRQDAFA